MTKHTVKQPHVTTAARTVGVIKPFFDPSIKGFRPPKLSISGTGFWIKDKNIFITCAHVIQHLLGQPMEVTGMLVVGGNGQEYKKATINSLDLSHDIAVLQVDADSDYILSQNHTGLELNSEQLQVSEEVAYAGFPFGDKLLNPRHSPTYAEGVIGQEIIDGVTQKWVQISGPVVGGYSGSPIVLKESGKLIGMVSNSPSDEAGSANIFRAVHWKHIKATVDLFGS